MCLNRAVWVGVMAATVLALSGAWAEDYQTNIVDGVYSNANGSYVVGDSGSYNLLIVSNAGMLSNTFCYIGNQAGAHDNVALVTNAGSLWTNNGFLYVGNTGSWNQLSVRGGARVANTDGVVGRNSSASNNTALVADAGSLWTNSNWLRIGWDGVSGALIVSNGGRVVNNAQADMGFGAGSRGNRVVVTGSGSVWSNRSNLNLGFGLNGSDNEALVNNAGYVLCDILKIGENASAFSNRLTVTGTGSMWRCTGALSVGGGGCSNSLMIAAGGYVRNTSGNLGYDATSSNNSVLVTDSGSVWSNSIGLYVGRNGGACTLVVSNGGRVVNSGGMCQIGNDAGSRDNRVVIVGADSVLSNRSTLTLGAFGSDNSLVVSNGGLVWLNNALTIGEDAVTHSNILHVTGTGSVCSSESMIFVGSEGYANSLIVSNGGLVRCLGVYAKVGHMLAASNNSVTIAGAGSVWSNAALMIVGNDACNNNLRVEDGGRLVAEDFVIGNATNASGNAAVVTGAGSLLTNSATLCVGATGSFNSLVVSSGGAAIARTGIVGWAASAGGNVATITGAGSLWTNSDVFVGQAGSYNTLIVTNGGRGGASDTTIGLLASASNNTLRVTGGDSIWSNRDSMVVGSDGVGNGVIVENGGRIDIGGDLIVGYTNDNYLVVDSGAMVRSYNFTILYVGREGNGNTLIVTNGGRLYVSGSYMGGYLQDGTYSNRAVVTGTGSLWSNSVGLNVGMRGTGHELIVSSGGAVVAQTVSLGTTSLATNSAIEVHASSTLTASESLTVGNGSFRLLGGTVDSGYLSMQDPDGAFLMSGGALTLQKSFISNGQVFVVGNGAQSATLSLPSTGVHTFVNGLLINTNAILTGTGAVNGAVTLAAGSKIRPGLSAGVLSVTGLTFRSGASLEFELGAAATDRVDVLGALIFDSVPVVTVKLANAGGASWTGAHALITYDTLAGTPSWTIDPGLTGVTNGRVLLNAGAKRYELIVANAPTVGSPVSSGIGATNADLGGSIASVNGANASERGVFWSTTNDFSPLEGVKVSESGDFAAGSFDLPVSGLTAGSRHYFCAFAVNVAGTNYSAQASFWTIPLAPAIAPITGVSSHDFIANWSASGGATNYRLDVATDAGFTQLVSGYASRSAGSVTSHAVTGLLGGVTYYARVRAQNAGGLGADSGMAEATTLSSAPSVNTVPVTSITTNSATGGGVVTHDGGVAVTARGVCWNITGSPTTNDSQTADGTGTGAFVSSLAGLNPDTTYHVRAYAINSVGIAYGDALVFTTLSSVVTGTIAIDVTPASGAWEISSCPYGYTGPLSGTGDLAPTTAPEGNYAVTFGPLAGYVTPATETKTLDAGEAILFSGVYVPWVPVVGDYDGDQLADPACVANGQWYQWLSGSNYAKTGPLAYGVSNGLPAAADFDGDRKADPASYVQGEWYVRLSSAGYIPFGAYAFGGTNDAPAPADFDGDQFGDPGVSDSQFWSVWLSSAGYAPVGPISGMGVAGAEPLAADFDGDGKADPAMCLDASWTIWLSASGYAPVMAAFGLPDALPAAGDFDGDSKADPAVYVGGNWYAWLSSAGYLRFGPFPMVP